jgi:hypothetical protein
MKHRFEGPDGLPLLIESLMKQDIVEHDRPLAEMLASVGELIVVELGKDLVVQGATDNDVYVGSSLCHVGKVGRCSLPAIR